MLTAVLALSASLGTQAAAQLKSHTVAAAQARRVLTRVRGLDTVDEVQCPASLCADAQLEAAGLPAGSGAPVTARDSHFCS